MLKSVFGIAVLAAFVGISGCATRAETVGTAGGAAAGYGLSGGSAPGTAAGGVVGYEAGKVYDHHNRR